MAAVAQAFTPGAPIDDVALFAGRIPQAQDVLSAASQKGQHVALYGERGVGKTSLANVLADLLGSTQLPRFRPGKVNCHTEDTYSSLWRNIFRELDVTPERSNGLSPDDVRYALQHLDSPALIIIDELDRLEDDEALTLLADTVKALSDHAIASTLVMVGVGQSIGELIGEHESISRALVKVHMPRMSLDELEEILQRGCERAELRTTPEAVAHITRLSRGLPHFTHLLGLHAGQRVVVDDRDEITFGDVVAAIPNAVDKHVVETDYMRAIHSPHADNLYPHVLLACALAPQDQFGFFTAGAVREPLAVITGRQLDIPAFARHLNQFMGFERGTALLRQGSPRRYVYRFRDPILQTYVILNGIARGLISEDQMTKLEVAGPPTPDQPHDPQPLF